MYAERNCETNNVVKQFVSLNDFFMICIYPLSYRVSLSATYITRHFICVRRLFFNEHTPLGGQLYLIEQVWVKIDTFAGSFPCSFVRSFNYSFFLSVFFMHSKQELTLSKKILLAYL